MKQILHLTTEMNDLLLPYFHFFYLSFSFPLFFLTHSLRISLYSCALFLFLDEDRMDASRSPLFHPLLLLSFIHSLSLLLFSRSTSSLFSLSLFYSLSFWLRMI